jgi:hypothetical protein
MVALWRYFAEPKGRCTAGKPKQAPRLLGKGYPAPRKLSTIKKPLSGLLSRFALLLRGEAAWLHQCAINISNLTC